ncbi:MAG: tripartite tricarboxylate transporter TctB family protein [Cetobacterium sp.]|uniref:tripartite tricarboxylate transporter TctB family protein n=1 Tax=Cetobacterium sp. TaxID=2071632 RepID=UPI002FCC6361
MERYDKYLSGFILFIAGIYYYFITQLPAKAGSYPKFVLTLLLFFTVILGIKSFISKKNDDKKKLFQGILPKQFLFIVITCLIYTAVLNIFGFFISTFIYLIVVMTGLKIKIKNACLVSCGFCVVIYLVFVIFLKVPVPSGILI